MPSQAARSRSTNAGGRETRQLLIRTAERLFAEGGIGGRDTHPRDIDYGSAFFARGAERSIIERGVR